MERDELILRLFQVVAKGLRHKHYANNVKKHKTYMQLVAGVGLDDLLKRYVRREDEALFKQRVNLTNHIVTSVCSNLMDVFYKVPRSNSARRVLTYSGNGAEEKTKVLEEQLSMFWNPESWDDYMATRFVELNETDPNAFVVIEWDRFNPDEEFLQPRPYEVFSAAAIDYRRNNKKLQYLIVEDEHWFTTNTDVNIITSQDKLDPNHGKEKGKKYTLYGPNQTWQLRQVKQEALGIEVISEEGTVVSFGQGQDSKSYVVLKGVYYQFEEYTPHNCGEVPAFDVGYYRDMATNGETFVNPLHPIEPYLLKTIKANSELDLVATLLALPQQVSYGDECSDDKCNNGYYANGNTCSTCNGDGMKATAPSAQDAIRMKKPDSKEEAIPLKDMITYIHPPVDIVEWQEKYIENLTTKMKRLMFNSDIFDRKQIADTASGKNLDMQNVYDTLHPFAVKFAKTWTFGPRITAKLIDKEEGLVVSYTFGKDFKLKSLDSLIFDLSIANKIGNPVLVRHLNDDIAQIIFAEKPLEYQRYQLKEMYNPFAGKSEKEIMLLMASPYVSEREKILHANYGKIFDELELASATNGKDFYKLNRSDQRKAIYNQVEVISKQLRDENPTPSIEI